MKKHLLSILLVLVMISCMIPNTVFAEDINSDSSRSEEYGTFIDGEHIISDMIEKNGMYAHPRIIMSEEKFSKLKTHIGDDSVTALLIDKLRNEADRTLDMPVCEYEIPDGIRLLETSKRIQRRVAALAMAYNIFGDEKYARRCYAELVAACNFQDWNPRHFLDTAEMSTGFAIGYDWLYNWMNDDQRAFIRNNLINKGLVQVMEDFEDKPRSRTYRWYQDYPGDNWKIVCSGSMSMAALAVGDEADAREIASEVLNFAYKEAYSFVRRAYSEKDGTYSEGLGYWDYATYYLGLHSSALASAVGTDYGLADFNGLRKSVDFIRYMSSNTSKSFSFGDDREGQDTGWSVLLWLGDYFKSYDIAAARIKSIRKGSFLYFDLLWIDEDKIPDSAKDSPTDWGEVGASNASFRNTWDESGIVAALHAGENNYKYHGHYDLGSFYIEYGGERFFTDLGNENYELPNRQYSYRIRAEGHNTLAINPSHELDQQEGAECLIISFGEGNEAFAVTDLTAAYEPSGAESVVRGLKMIKDKECVIIQDEVVLNAPGDVYWFAHTKGQIEVADDGRSAVVTVGSEKMWVGLISDNGVFTVMDAEPLPESPVVQNQTDNSEYRKLAVHLTNTKDTTISVACIPLKGSEIRPLWTPSVKAIDEWTSQLTEGDVNNDGEFNISDVVLLQKWLLAAPDTHLANWKAADLCANNRLNVLDLCLMRRKLIEKSGQSRIG
ncbi:MAG: heparinase II/III family protein [Ruminococcus sp.]|nr:heparinase II/III family protein [Ruminococcus sp.]